MAVRQTGLKAADSLGFFFSQEYESEKQLGFEKHGLLCNFFNHHLLQKIKAQVCLANHALLWFWSDALVLDLQDFMHYTAAVWLAD